MKADNDSSVTLKNDDVEQLSLKLAYIDAQVDGLAMLATTGDITALKKGGLCASLLDIGDRITEAKRFLDDLHARASKTASAKLENSEALHD